VPQQRTASAGVLELVNPAATLPVIRLQAFLPAVPPATSAFCW